MKNLYIISSERFAFFCVCLLPLTIIIGQAAISLNYFLVTICFFLLLNNQGFRSLIKDNFFYVAPFFIYLIISQIINLKMYDFNTLNKSIFYIKNFFLFFVLFYTLKSDRYKKIFLYIIFFCCLFVSLDNIFQYFVGYDFFGIKKSSTRLTGPFGENEFVSGSYLAKLSIIFLPLFLSKKNFFNLHIFYLAIIFLFFSILITGERASTFLFIFGTLLFYFFYAKSLKNIFLLSSFFTIILILMICFNQNTKYKFLQTSYQIGIMKYLDSHLDTIPKNFQDYENRSFLDSKHGAHFLTAIEIWKKNKFFGVGAKNFTKECSKEYYEKIKSLSNKYRCSAHTHNIYLELLSENGVIGFLLFLLIIYKVFKLYFNSQFKKNYFLISSLAQSITLLWPIISTGSLISNFNGVFIWLNLAFLASICHYGFKNNEK